MTNTGILSILVGFLFVGLGIVAAYNAGYAAGHQDGQRNRATGQPLQGSRRVQLPTGRTPPRE